MDYLYLAGTAHALFFAMLILTKNRKKFSDFILVLFILLLGAELFFTFALYTGLYPRLSQLGLLDILFWSLSGPALLLYARQAAGDADIKNWQYGLYLVPFAISMAAFGPMLNKTVVFYRVLQPGMFYRLAHYVWFFNLPIFILAVFRQLMRHQDTLKHEFSNTGRIDLKWLLYLTIGFSLFLFFLYISWGLYRLTGIPVPETYQFKWLVFTAYVFGLGFWGYRQPDVLISRVNFDRPAGVGRMKLIISGQSAEAGPQYVKSGLSDEQAETLSRELSDFMSEDKPYLDCELSLSSLARSLNATPHNLSQVINTHFGKNFFEFVNDYRIEEVKQHLVDPQKRHYKIISIAYDCGFSSKSSFYLLFKKNTSLTPAQYQRQHLSLAV